jgi:hypothetical protein
MRRTGYSNLPGLPGMPLPNPWPMGVIAIGAGVTLWWLTPTAVRREEETSRAVWGDRSSWGRWPDATRRYYVVSWRVGSALMVVLGVIILGAQIARA